jgi:hypothetical protein
MHVSVETEYADWLLKNKLDPTVVQNGLPLYLSEAQLMDLRRQAQAARLHEGMMKIINAGGSQSDAWEWRAAEFERMHGRDFDFADALLAVGTLGLSLLWRR